MVTNPHPSRRSRRFPKSFRSVAGSDCVRRANRAVAIRNTTLKSRHYTYRYYVRQGIRNIAADLCTRQPGYRTEPDGAEAEGREVTEKRFTSIDKRLLRDALKSILDHFTIIRNSAQAEFSEPARSCTRHDAARLAVLRQMGLAESAAPSRWRVRRHFDEILRAMQRTADRQRTLAAHGAWMSDERLHIEVPDLRQLTFVEGRVRVHGQDEQTERIGGQLLFEAEEIVRRRARDVEG